MLSQALFVWNITPWEIPKRRDRVGGLSTADSDIWCTACRQIFNTADDDVWCPACGQTFNTADSDVWCTTGCATLQVATGFVQGVPEKGVEGILLFTLVMVFDELRAE